MKYDMGHLLLGFTLSFSLVIAPLIIWDKVEHAAAFSKSLDKSPLHRQVLTQYRDVCLKESSSSDCIDEAISNAKAGGYTQDLENILADAMISYDENKMMSMNVIWRGERG